jgi:hypothetical protein
MTACRTIHHIRTLDTPPDLTTFYPAHSWQHFPLTGRPHLFIASATRGVGTSSSTIASYLLPTQTPVYPELTKTLPSEQNFPLDTAAGF